MFPSDMIMVDALIGATSLVTSLQQSVFASYWCALWGEQQMTSNRLCSFVNCNHDYHLCERPYRHQLLQMHIRSMTTLWHAFPPKFIVHSDMTKDRLRWTFDESHPVLVALYFTMRLWQDACCRVQPSLHVSNSIASGYSCSINCIICSEFIETLDNHRRVYIYMYILEKHAPHWHVY